MQEVLQSLEVPHAWHYTGLESPNGEAGFLNLYHKNISPYRVKIKTPSLALAQAIPHFVLGIREEQVKTCLASLGIRSHELDR